MKILMVFLGGGIGSLLRYATGEFISKFSTNNFPVATLVANITSTVILAAYLYFYEVRYGASSILRLLFITGICGGFSTFSTFSLETFQLIKNGQAFIAVANIAISITACLMVLFMLSKNMK